MCACFTCIKNNITDNYIEDKLSFTTNLARMCYQASRGLYGAQARNIGPQWGPGHAGEGGQGRQG